MKIFIYKTLSVMFLAYVVFEFTVGRRLDKFESRVETLKSKEQRDRTLDKIKEEIRRANNRDYILSQEDRVLISDFINKLKKELALE